MSGPAYPRINLPGSNAIGSFIIGVSPIGDIPPFDPWSSIISQYSNSPILDALITSFNAAMDFTANFDAFYDNMLNVQTAVGYGLDAWGRIVGVSRVLQLPSGSTYLGFEEATGSWVPFGQGVFYSGTTLTSNYILSDTDFRRLILAKAAGNISDGSIPSMNAILLALFPNRGKIYIADNLNMTATITCAFTLTPVELAILELPNVLPIPVGVVTTIVQT